MISFCLTQSADHVNLGEVQHLQSAQQSRLLITPRILFGTSRWLCAGLRHCNLYHRYQVREIDRSYKFMVDQEVKACSSACGRPLMTSGFVPPFERYVECRAQHNSRLLRGSQAHRCCGNPWLFLGIVQFARVNWPSTPSVWLDAGSLKAWMATW